MQSISRVSVALSGAVLFLCHSAAGQDVAPTFSSEGDPPAVIVGATSGMAPFCVHVKTQALNTPHSTGAAGGQNWWQGTFEWRFTKDDGSPLDTGDRVTATDTFQSPSQTVYLDTDQKGWNAACWLPVQGDYIAQMRYRNSEGLYSAWQTAVDPLTGDPATIEVTDSDRGVIWVSGAGNDSNCGQTLSQAVQTLDRAIALINSGGCGAGRKEIIIDGEEGPVELIDPATLTASDLYIHGLWGIDVPRSVVRIMFDSEEGEGETAFTLASGCNRLVVREVEFIPGINDNEERDPVNLFQVANATVTNTTFMNCSFGHGTAENRRFNSVWVASGGLANLHWDGVAWINCIRKGDAMTKGATLFGLPHAWTIWGCTWGGSVNEYTCRLEWAHANPDPGGTLPGWHPWGQSSHVSIQFSDLNHEDGGKASLRSYVAQYVAAHGTNFRHGSMSLGNKDADGYQDASGQVLEFFPQIVRDYRFTRCRFEFDDDDGVDTDTMELALGFRQCRFDGCYFRQQGTMTVAKLQPLNDSTPVNQQFLCANCETTVPVKFLNFTNCTFERTEHGTFYDEDEVEDWGTLQEAVLFRNNLLVLPSSGTPQPHFVINEEEHASPRVEYDFKNNVYRDLGGSTVYAVVEGSNRTFSGWESIDFVGESEVQEQGTHSVNTSTLAPNGTTVLTSGSPAWTRGSLGWNGSRFYGGAASCYSGAYQPVQVGVTLTGDSVGGEPPPGTVNLAWTNVGADGYWIHFGEASGASEDTAVFAIPAGSIPELTPSATYYFRAMAFTDVGSLSKESNEITAVP